MRVIWQVISARSLLRGNNWSDFFGRVSLFASLYIVSVPYSDRYPGIQIPPPCDLTLGMECVEKSTAGVSIWKMRAEERFANPTGVMQGGFIAAFIDSAMGAATVTYAGRKIYTSNIDLAVSFMNPARIDSILTCVASVISGGEKILFVDADVHDEHQRHICRAHSTYFLRARES